jgi:acetolactate synthase, small subunit
MKRIYSVLVENRSGVLAKVAGLFWRRCFNIDSLTVGETEDSAVSNMVIVSSGEERTLEQVEKQLNKKLDTIKVRTFTENQGLCRELLMVKLRYKRDNRKDIMENCQILGAKIAELSRSQMIIEMCDTPERINMFLDTLKTVSILECARTGTLAMLKISESENK